MGHGAAVRLLVQAGAPVNAQDCNGDTPLHNACRSNHCAAVSELLQHSDIVLDVRKVYGETPLKVASKSGHDEIVALIQSSCKGSSS